MADYPAWLETTERLPDGSSIEVRPIKPEDWPLLQPGLMQLSPEDRHFRFMGGFDTIPDEMAKRLATVDYETEIAIAAIDDAGGPAGLLRMAPSGPGRVELALVILPAWQQRGLGRLLATRGLAWAERVGIKTIELILLAENRGMRRLAETLGFKLRPMPEEFGVLQGELKVEQPT